MVIVCFPPMRRSGYVFSFGSGFVGQLALGEEYYSPTPMLVQRLVDMNVTAKFVIFHADCVSCTNRVFCIGSFGTTAR